MSLKSEIKLIEKSIKYKEDEILRLKEKKDKLETISKEFPNIEYKYGSYISTTDISEQLSCMALQHEYREIIARFHLSPAKNKGMKIYSNPSKHTIASINYNYNYGNGKHEKVILIHDYDKIINDKCPFKKKFLKRIKYYLIRKISEYNYTISNNSYNKEVFDKLILLK